MGFLDTIKGMFGGAKNGSTSSPSGKMTGKIIHFNYRKGYGFVEADGVESKIFLHVSELTGKARKGKGVEFKIEKTEKGVKAKEAIMLD
jgi:cold shock CspA family protein